MKNSIRILVIILTVGICSLPAYSQDTTAIRKKIDELLGSNYPSSRINIESTKEMINGYARIYSTVIEDDLAIMIHEFENDSEFNSKKEISIKRIHLVKYANAEFTTSNFYRNDEYGVSASIIIDNEKLKFYNLFSMFYKENLLYELMLLTSKEKTFEKGIDQYGNLFFID